MFLQCMTARQLLVFFVIDISNQIFVSICQTLIESILGGQILLLLVVIEAEALIQTIGTIQQQEEVEDVVDPLTEILQTTGTITHQAEEMCLVVVVAAAAVTHVITVASKAILPALVQTGDDFHKILASLFKEVTHP